MRTIVTNLLLSSTTAAAAADPVPVEAGQAFPVDDLLDVRRVEGAGESGAMVGYSCHRDAPLGNPDDRGRAFRGPLTATVANPEIETTASTVVYRNPWMTVREDAIRRADGAAGVYGVVEKLDFAVVAAIGDGHVHLVEQYRYPVSGRYWELPQGASHDPALEPLKVARAELREETGLVAATMTHVGRLFQSYGFSTQAFDLFVATGLEQHAMQLEAEEEGLIAKAFPLAVFEAMIRDGSIRDSATVASFALLRLEGWL